MVKIIPRQYRPAAALLVVFLVIVALMLAARYHLFPFAVDTQRTPQTSIRVATAAVAAINKPIRIDRTGSIENATSVPVYTEFSGMLTEVYVTEGEAVKAGQPLLKLEGYSASAGTTESPAEAEASQDTGTSQQARDNYDNALKEVNRYKKLYEIGAIPRRQLENATARLQQAEADLNSGQNAAPSPHSNTSAPITLHGSATVTAPTDGRVMGLSTAPGKAVQAGQQLMALGSGQEVELVVHIDQNDLYLVHLGTTATAEAANQIITGQVSSIYPEAEGDQIASFLAHIKLTDNPDGLLKPGMSAHVHIDTGASEPVLAIPSVAVFRDEAGQNFVYVAADGRAVRQPISIGEAIGDYTEITSGVPQGTVVITSNINEIKNGDAIAVMQ
jgi:membrane fusion protein (multidrug efflux system)